VKAIKNEIAVVGIDDVMKALGDMAPKYAKNLIRSTVHGVASEIAKQVKESAPYKTNNLKKSVKAKRRKSPPAKPVSEVYFTHGDEAKYDGFYWRFIEHGTKGNDKHNALPARPFVQPIKDEFSQKMPEIIREQFVKKLTKMTNAQLKKNAKRVSK